MFIIFIYIYVRFLRFAETTLSYHLIRRSNYKSRIDKVVLAAKVYLILLANVHSFSIYFFLDTVISNKENIRTKQKIFL